MRNHYCMLLSRAILGALLSVLLLGVGSIKAQSHDGEPTPSVVLLDHTGKEHATLVGTRNIYLPSGQLPEGVDTIRLPKRYLMRAGRIQMSQNPPLKGKSPAQAKGEESPKSSSTQIASIGKGCGEEMDDLSSIISEADRAHEEAMQAHEEAMRAHQEALKAHDEAMQAHEEAMRTFEEATSSHKGATTSHKKAKQTTEAAQGSGKTAVARVEEQSHTRDAQTSEKALRSPAKASKKLRETRIIQSEKVVIKLDPEDMVVFEF